MIKINNYLKESSLSRIMNHIEKTQTLSFISAFLSEEPEVEIHT